MYQNNKLKNSRYLFKTPPIYIGYFTTTGSMLPTKFEAKKKRFRAQFEA